MNYMDLGLYIPMRFNAERHSVRIPVTEHITIAGPGKYGTNKLGSDFVVLVTNSLWDEHKVAWGEIFETFDALTWDDRAAMLEALEHTVLDGGPMDGLNWFIQTVAVLCYCEHRRYSGKFTAGGGKALPLNILADIHTGRNSGVEAAKYMRTGIANVKRVTYRGVEDGGTMWRSS